MRRLGITGHRVAGHSTGHLLSALAQAYASSGNTAFKTKGDSLVTVLAQCQSRAATAGFNTGFLAAFPESFIDRVEARQDVWAPYYTLHKIMAGLLDMYLLAGNSQALTVLTGMASWVKFRNDRLSSTQRQDMLDTEFGGMNEVLTNLYQVTGDVNHLAAAQQFDHAEIFDPLATNTDRLSGYHANTQIPKIIGAIREYHATGSTRYRDIAVNFWDIVTRHHTYAIGGNSNGEYFKAPDRISSEVNGTATAAPATGAYATISRTWASGDVVDVTLPMALTREPSNDNASVQAVKVGPIVLGGLFGTGNLSALPTLNPATLAPTSTPLQYTANGVTLAPFYKVHGQR